MKNKLLKGYLKNKLKMYFLENDNYVGNVIASTGDYEAYETKIILDNIKEGDIVIDVGANIGFHTIMFANKVGPTGKVFAFEPDPVSYEILSKNIKENNFKNIIACPLAISNKKSRLNLYKSNTNYGDNRVYESSDIISDKFKVDADSLDNFLDKEMTEKEKISLIKIDTQGFEPFVIEGAKKTLEKYMPTLFFEYWPYGYSNSNSDGTRMLRYIEKLYRSLYLIDDNNENIKKQDIVEINEYCRQLNGYLHANLFCTANGFDRMNLYLSGMIKQLATFIDHE